MKVGQSRESQYLSVPKANKSASASGVQPSTKNSTEGSPSLASGSDPNGPQASFQSLLAMSMMSGMQSSTESSSPPKANGSDSRFSYDRIATRYTDYQNDMKSSGSADYAKSLGDNRAAYLDIVKKAEAQNGFNDPVNFVKSLNATELGVLQKTHSLADAIQTNSLTKEGALNLILPSNESLDINHDGFNQVGAASMIVFPPHDAPQAVQDAWQKATAGLDAGTTSQMSLQMWMGAGGGGPTTAVSDGAATSTASWYDSTFSWKALIDRVMAGAEANRAYESTDTQRAFGDKLRSGYQALSDAFDAAKIT